MTSESHPSRPEHRWTAPRGSLDGDLEERLDSLRAQGLHRSLRRIASPQGREVTVQDRNLLNFSSNDYLGLANHPKLKAAAAEAIATWGTGSGASRLISGSLLPHHELEQKLALFKGTESALSFSSGYAAALGTITALLGREDVVILDRLVHACVVDAARLSGAKLRIFPHNDLEALEDVLRWAGKRPARNEAGRIRRTLIVTETVFSMDGDVAPLKQIVELKERYGVWLMIDEAHATGVYGEGGRGVAEAMGVADRVEIQMGTLSKALGTSGGYVCGSQALVEYLVNRARSFVFSTAPPPATAAAACAALNVVDSPEGKHLRNELWARVAELAQAMQKSRLTIQSPIAPIPIGNEERAMEVAGLLANRGFLIPAIRYPTVARGKARLRLSLSAAHQPADVCAVAGELSAILP